MFQSNIILETLIVALIFTGQLSLKWLMYFEMALRHRRVLI